MSKNQFVQPRSSLALWGITLFVIVSSAFTAHARTFYGFSHRGLSGPITQDAFGDRLERVLVQTGEPELAEEVRQYRRDTLYVSVSQTLLTTLGMGLGTLGASAGTLR